MPTEEFFNRDQITPADADQMLRFVESSEFTATNSGTVSFGTLVGAAEQLHPEFTNDFEIGGVLEAFSYEPVYVPVDVQALVVTSSGLNGDLVAQPFADPLAGDPPILPFADSSTDREPGVHLHWALPDALLRGEMSEDDAGEADLGLRPLPDFWTVLRIMVPRNSTAADVTGFVVLSKDAKVIPLEEFVSLTQDADSVASPLQDGVLNAASGGSLNWTATYEASLGRFAIHDPLTDIPALETNQATYLVIGRWLNRNEDPLYAVDSALGFEDALVDFGWKTTTPVAQFRAELASGNPWVNAVLLKKLLEDPAWAGLDSLLDLIGPDGELVDQPLLRRKQSIFHGLIHGVPIRGAASGDHRPSQSSISVGFGTTEDRVLASLTADSGGISDRDQQEAVETTLAAFTAQILDRLNSADGLVEIEQSMHRSEFSSLPATDAVVDRYRVAEASALPAGRLARGLQSNLPFGVTATTSVRVARSRSAAGTVTGATADASAVPAAAVSSTSSADPASIAGGVAGAAAEFAPAAERLTEQVQAVLDQPLALHAVTDDEILDVRAVLDQVPDRLTAETFANIPESREVPRPGPTFHQPVEPVVMLSGAGTSPRHGGDGRFSDDGRMLCRQAGELQVEYAGALEQSNVLLDFDLPYFPAGANGLVVEAVMTSPFFVSWLSERAASGTDAEAPVFNQRFQAEMAIRFTRNGTYAGKSLPPLGGDLPPLNTSPHLSVLTEDLLLQSLLRGTEPDPVGVSVWASQPWIPLWLEWEVEFTFTNSLGGWTLAAVDLEENSTAGRGPSFDKARTIRGRSMVNTRSGKVVADAISDWLDAENARDLTGDGVLGELDERVLADVMDATADIDLTSTTLSDLHDALLGLVGDGGEDPFTLKDDAGQGIPVIPKGAPELLVSGELRLVRARIVDAFGRTLDVPAARTIPEADRPSDNRKVLTMPPRILRPSRFNLELIGAGDQRDEPARARVDQIDPDSQVNPVMGFLLHDHIDEALELFDRNGDPLGQLTHDSFSGAVAWQVAPGRPLPPDATPRDGLESHSHYMGEMAAELVDVDLRQRQGLPRSLDDDESPLSAMLRAIDTTLWTVDTYSAAGSEHVAGLIGRPIAMVHAVLDLEVEDDLDELDLSDPVNRQAREQAYEDLRNIGVRVRLGELTRADDGLLGFFVDHDYRRLRLVDKVVQSQATDGGRHRAHFGRYGFTPLLPPRRPLDNEYLFAEDELMIRYGEPRRITLLMLPGGRTHLTSGLLPRNWIQLARDWVGPGLARIAPSVRVGPVLVDRDQVRLPLVSTLTQSQLWTRRDTPTTWRDDPIEAATQTAFLPDMPARLEEGYIRVMPGADPMGDAGNGDTP